MKRIEINGKFFRKREGKLVQIPDEWVGKTVHPQTIRKRKQPGHGIHAKHLRYQDRKREDASECD